ncbi:MAG: tetratricopeptide repeat protein [Candidatus Delongbacteria bacterium]|nr:tetratricopeptide repeat protein [Candidatus Delongbacteria bacterium]
MNKIFLWIILFSVMIEARDRCDSLITLIDTSDVKASLSIYLQLAEEYNNRKSDSVLSYINLATEAADRLNDHRSRTAALIERGIFHDYRREFALAEELYHQSMIMATDSNYMEMMAKITYQLARLYNKTDQTQKARLTFTQSVKYYSRCRDSLRLAKTLREKGLFLWRQSEYDSALICLNHALAVSTSLKDPEPRASILNSIGVIYWQWAYYEKALEYYSESLKIRQQLKDISGECLTLNNIGRVYLEWGKIESGMSTFLEALEKGKPIRNDILVTGYTYHNLGYAWEISQNYDSALYYYNVSLKVYERDVPDNGGIILDLNALANIYNLKADYDQALELARQALIKARKSNNREREANALKNIGTSYWKKRQYDSAIENLRKSIEIAGAIRQRALMRDNYLKLSEIYQEMGLWKIAHQQYLIYDTIRDSMFNESNNRIILDLQIKYQTQQKEKENLRLMGTQQLQDAELERQHWTIILGGLVLVLTIGFSGILIYVNRVKTKMNVVLQSGNQEIARQRDDLQQKTGELETALNNIKTLNGLLPICSNCKKIRDDEGYWKEVETYISAHSEASFSHSLCPDCARKIYPELRK